MWDLPPSPESDTDAQPAPLVLVAPALPPGLRRGRGRPPGPGRWAREVQEQFLQQHGLSQQPDRCANARAHIQVVPHEPAVCSSLNILQAVGPPVAKLIVAALQLPWSPDQVDADDKKMFSEMLGGPSTRRLMGHAAHAATLGMESTKCRRHTLDLAACTHSGSRVWTSSLLSWLLGQHAGEKVRLLMALRYTLYDETPLPLRSKTGSNQSTSSTLQSLSDAPPPGAGDTRRAAGISKVVQTEAAVCVVFQELASDKWFCWSIPLSSPLQIVDRGTSACLKACWHQQWDLPMLDELLTRFYFVVDATTCDRASANDLCEDTLALSFPWAHLRVPCLAHIASTSQGHAFAPLATTISGMIAASLAQRPAGAASTFRNCIAEVLEASVRPVSTPPPGDDDPHRKQLLAMLDLCLDKRAQGTRRRIILQESLGGDPAQDRIYWHHGGGEGAAVDIKDWSSKVATALYPALIQPFPVQRWVSSLSTFQAYGLLTLFNILDRALERWLCVCEQRPTPPIRMQEDVMHSSSGELWDLPLDDVVDRGREAEAEEEEEAAEETGRPAALGRDAKYAEENRRNRGGPHGNL